MPCNNMAPTPMRLRTMRNNESDNENIVSVSFFFLIGRSVFVR